ncbi:uncharacterized protein METZ01_LOCUS490710 [marine metagenome]|uniref:Uncharacterized protein n=1 Tax=marine metagenome TaxID=408172 RepID=A0A383CZX6_9ZZZZ
MVIKDTFKLQHGVKLVLMLSKLLKE